MLNDVIPRKLSQSPNWALRPITADLLLTACEECHCLITSLYRLIFAQLPEGSRQLFDAKCHEAVTLSSSPFPFNNCQSMPLNSNGPMKNGGFQNPPFRIQQCVLQKDINGFESSRYQLDSNAFFNNGIARPSDIHNNFPVIPPAPHTPHFRPPEPTRIQHVPIVMKPPPKKMVTVGTQTISTGEITIQGIYEAIDGSVKCENPAEF